MAQAIWLKLFIRTESWETSPESWETSPESWETSPESWETSLDQVVLVVVVVLVQVVRVDLVALAQCHCLPWLLWWFADLCLNLPLRQTKELLPLPLAGPMYAAVVFTSSLLVQTP